MRDTVWSMFGVGVSVLRFRKEGEGPGQSFDSPCAADGVFEWVLHVRMSARAAVCAGKGRGASV